MGRQGLTGVTLQGREFTIISSSGALDWTSLLFMFGQLQEAVRGTERREPSFAQVCVFSWRVDGCEGDVMGC